MKPATILIPLDGSRLAEAALAEAMELAIIEVPRVRNVYPAEVSHV